MSANVIQKDKVARIAAWKMEAFNAPEPKEQFVPHAEQIKRLQRSAHNEGFDKGYREGIASAQADVEKIGSLLKALETDLEHFDEQIAEDTLQFALVLSQTILRSSLNHHPQLILAVVRDALAEISTRGETRQLHLHPDDAALLSQFGAELGKIGQIEIIEDADIERGGCSVRTTHAEVDASLKTRWKRALATLGRNDDWLDSADASAADVANRPSVNDASAS